MRCLQIAVDNYYSLITISEGYLRFVGERKLNNDYDFES